MSGQPDPSVPLNRQFGTRPLVIHGHGHHANKPAWEAFQTWYRDARLPPAPPPRRVTLITCNNGHPAMGLFERSCARLGLPVRVGGDGCVPWNNARDKPRVILELLARVDTPYVLYADSRDAVIVGDPETLVDRLVRAFPGDALAFGGDRMNWPPLSAYKRNEDALAANSASEFRYLNGGCWLGGTATARRVFAMAAARPPIPQAPGAEQAVLKQLLLEKVPGMVIDMECRLFQNLGFAPPETLAFPVEAAAPRM